MKIELIEQMEPFSDQAWYGVRVNGTSVKWSKDKGEIEKVYNEIISNPDIIKTKEIILKSQEIEVPLSEQKQ
jgi:hypothetical protein